MTKYLIKYKNKYKTHTAIITTTMSVFIVIIVSIINLIMISECVPRTITTTNKQKQELSISECVVKMGECDESKGRPVCGTDDQTYPSRCHLLRVQCSGHEVSVKYRGPCKACIEARDYALKHRGKNAQKFIPRCKADGTYALVQCLIDTGCWCSDVTGKPIENTSVRTGKPHCREYGKPNIRRSPSRNMGVTRNRRICTQTDRAKFNGNLMKTFQSEYMRIRQFLQENRDFNKVILHTKSINNDHAIIIDWKFSNLDINSNDLLDRNEYRELKKLIKRAVRPRRCGRAFGKFCDINNDERLSRLEWNSCLSFDGINKNHHQYKDNSESATTYGSNFPSGSLLVNNNSYNKNHRYNHHSHHHHQQHDYHQQLHNHHTQTHNSNNNVNNNQNHLYPDSKFFNNTINGKNESGKISTNSNFDDDNSHNLEYDEDFDYGDEENEDDGDNLAYMNAFGASTKFPSIHFLIPKAPDSQLTENESEYDCLTDQAAALEEQRHGNTLIYVPECIPDGRYQRIQCYRSTPYCWCVNEETGKNIPGTSVKDRRPQCDAIYTITRPMKGCPEPRKTTFLKNLKEYLKTYIIAGSNSGTNTTKWNNEDERIASLSFVIMDKNKNKSWERKEWKLFRELVTNTKTLRKCGKKLPKYCDINGDKKITLTEWATCLQVESITQKSDTHTNNIGSVSSKPLKLTGSNPLEQYLRD